MILKQIVKSREGALIQAYIYFEMKRHRTEKENPDWQLKSKCTWNKFRRRKPKFPVSAPTPQSNLKLLSQLLNSLFHVQSLIALCLPSTCPTLLFPTTQPSVSLLSNFFKIIQSPYSQVVSSLLYHAGAFILL